MRLRVVVKIMPKGIYSHPRRCGKWTRKHRLEYYKKYNHHYSLSQQQREHKKEYTKKHNKEYNKKYRLKNIDKKRERDRKYARTTRKQKRKLRRQTDHKFRLDSNTATLIWYSLRGKKAGQKWEKLVGYTIDNLIRHLEDKFDDKMTWDNYGSYWWVDHIKPRSLFKYKTAEDPEFKKCWSLENLQPLEKIANIKKGNRFKTVE